MTETEAEALKFLEEFVKKHRLSQNLVLVKSYYVDRS